MSTKTITPTITVEVTSLIYKEVDRLKTSRLAGEISVETMEQWGCFLNNLAKDIMITGMDGRKDTVFTEKHLLEKIRELAASCVLCLEENL